MTKEEKQLLLKDLCARFPYGVICRLSARDSDISITEKLKIGGLEHFISGTVDVKPYLRPMSSMTEEEKKMVCSMNGLSDTELNDRIEYQNMYVQNYTIETFDLFNAHHLDYRGLIEKSLALVAPDNMYR